MGAKAIEKNNISFNKNLHLPDGLISGQGVCGIDRMRFGLASMAANGSGAIAVFNLLQLLGKPCEFVQTAAEVYRFAGFFFGFFGINPLRLTRVFEHRYIPTMQNRSYRDFIGRMDTSSCAVVSYWTGRPYFSRLRTVAVEHRPAGFRVYNRFDNRPNTYDFKNPADFIDEKSFFVGYCCHL